MSAMGLRWSKVVGSGSYLPPRVVTNQELSQELAEKGIETSDDWIVERTGIRQRHLVEPGVKTSFLAIQAAQAALEQAGINAADVDLIVLATSTPDRVFPSTACMVQAALGCEQAAAFDVQAVCSGFVYAMATADSMIRTGQAQCALVIGADVFSRIIDWNDRGTCVLFGDGAGALVLKASDEPGIIANDLGADGRYDEILCTQGSVAYGELVGDPFLRMDGQSVFKLAVNVLGKSAKKVVAKADIELSQVDWLVPHQANVRILQAIAKKLAMPLEKVVITVDQHANTSAATVPLAYDAAVRDGRIQSGQLVMLQGVGGGFTWGSVLIRV